jgi:hypothetical protein
LRRSALGCTIEHVFEKPECAAPSLLSGVPEPRREADAAAATATVVSPPVRALVDAVEALLAQEPAELPGPQALADATELLTQFERLRGAVQHRVADVDARKLHALAHARSAQSWVAEQQTSLGREQVTLARRLTLMPRLDEAVRAGALSLDAAAAVGKALTKLRRHVDRMDHRIDEQPAEEALLGVIGHGVPQLICQALGGLADDDPRLAAVLAAVEEIVHRPDSELARLEAAFVLLAVHLEPAQLPGALGTLVDALLPNQLEKRAADGHVNRGFTLRRNHDGSGYHVTDGELDLECGELLETVLQAELAVDEDNPADTAGYEQLRAQGWQPGDELPDTDGPRSLRQRRHDALKNGLRRYLSSGIAGTRGKVAPHLAVTVGLDTLHGAPGALPAVGASGAQLPLSLVRRWWCDSTVSRFVLSLGRKVLETSHTERTLKAHERRAKQIETGGACQGAGCGRSGTIPHHPTMFSVSGTTSFADTVWFCELDHHHLHSGKTVRLKNGRRLNEQGWIAP